MVNTCREIVRAVIDYGVEKDDWKKTWKADARVRTSSGLPVHSLPVHFSFSPQQQHLRLGTLHHPLSLEQELAVQGAGAA